KKGISDNYKEYHDESRGNNGIFQFGNSKDDEAQSKRCNLNMEQVTEIGEMIGVSWKLAEDVMSRKKVEQPDIIGLQETKIGFIDDFWVKDL
ncbi:reverse transcriptase domain, reverse transcriptase zinc-binding domain protein, partial [Tanacetum coccineum]